MISKINIAILDDSAVALKLLNNLIHSLISKENLNLQHFSDGQEFINYSDFNKEIVFQLVITDINMPRKDGIEVIKYIRSKENSQKNCSIFVISANKSRDVITECLRLGANDYLMKPFQPESVKEKVKASIIKILRANHNNLPENNNNKNITISEINSIKEKYYIANKLSNSEKAIIEDFINNL